MDYSPQSPYTYPSSHDEYQYYSPYTQTHYYPQQYDLDLSPFGLFSQVDDADLLSPTTSITNTTTEEDPQPQTASVAADNINHLDLTLHL